MSDPLLKRIFQYYWVALNKKSFPGHFMKIIQQKLARLVNSVNGSVGICVQPVESLLRIDYNARICFPRASTFKFPVAINILSLVDQGLLTLQ